jgi:cytochrome c-type biogenesis protein CcmH/NrfG
MDNSNTMTHSLLAQAYRSTGRLEDARKENEMMQKLQAASAPKMDPAH